MEREANIRLNIDEVGAAKAREEVARLIVQVACGYTRDGGAPTITADCTNIRTLEREAVRLKSEIDEAVSSAREHYGKKPARAKAKSEPAAAEDATRPPARISTDLKVRDVMTRDVRTVDENGTLSVADELMKVGNFRHVVALDGSGSVTGVISRRDIFHGALAWSLGLGGGGFEKILAQYPVKQVMSANPVTVDPDAGLAEAAEVMMRHKVGSLPVMDGTQLVGILTEGDFLALLAASEAAEPSAAN